MNRPAGRRLCAYGPGICFYTGQSERLVRRECDLRPELDVRVRLGLRLLLREYDRAKGDSRTKAREQFLADHRRDGAPDAE
ncbi:hypothetical protein EVAR_103090_1 [Eumeta japonica]|uniref:Uncharacterized protein n=1 Tax=Eumeta variegata TaxID=151549 RepID=A0A4C1WRA7_EUMVA|nr:hypothetical protein EVAR_103090_1 [Eumeta japonica]